MASFSLNNSCAVFAGGRGSVCVCVYLCIPKYRCILFLVCVLSGLLALDNQLAHSSLEKTICPLSAKPALFRHPHCYYSLFLLCIYFPFSWSEPPLFLSPWSNTLLFPSPRLPNPSNNLLILLVSASTLRYILTPEDVQLGSPDKREHVMFARLEYLTFS